jgi:uncharacterized protein YkwD
MHLARAFAAALLALSVGSSVHAAPMTSSTTGEARAAVAAVDVGVQAALTRINQLRRQAGAAPLVLNSQLTAAAAGHANDMAVKKYFSHTSKDGRSPGQRITATGYRYSTYGENIAWGYADWNAAITAWMQSQGHRANILNARFKHIGLGVKNRYYVTDFATPR